MSSWTECRTNKIKSTQRILPSTSNILKYSSAIVGSSWGLLPPKQHREREKLLCYSGLKSVRECAELSIGCDVITKGRVWGPSNGAFGALVKIYL